MKQVKRFVDKKASRLGKVLVCLTLGAGLLLGLISTGLLPVFADSVLVPNDSRRAPRTVDEQQIIDAYRRTNKAVVNINSLSARSGFYGPGMEEGSGSGVIIDAKKGYILTNFHVIGSAERLAVTLHTGSNYAVKAVGVDPDNDIALLQLVDPPSDIVAAPLGDSSSLEVGQRVLAIGNPFGLNRTLTTGIVSSVGRSIRAESGRLIEDIVQTDAAINPGNSGGPLLDVLGRVVALNTAIVSKVGESSGIGFAIPINTVVASLPDLVQYGKVRRPKMGVVLADTEFGPVLLYVKPGSPAAEAGLSGAQRRVRRGAFAGYVLDFNHADFIVAVEGKSVSTKADVLDSLRDLMEGDEVEMTVRKGLQRDRTRSVSVVPELS